MLLDNVLTRPTGIAALTVALSFGATDALADGFASDRITVSVEGEGPDVVLIPGLGASAAVWNGLVLHLDGYQVHRVEVLGFGGHALEANAEGPLIEPIAEEIERYLAAEAPDGAVLIGHSMGGTLALTVAADVDLGGVILVDTPPDLGTLFAGPAAGPDEVRAMAEGMLNRMEAADDAEWIEQARTFVGASVNDPDARERVLADYLASDRGTLSQAFHELLISDLGPLLPRIEEPVAVIYATSPAGPEATTTFYEQSYALLNVVLSQRIDGAAHYVMLDTPDAFAAAVAVALAAF